MMRVDGRLGPPCPTDDPLDHVCPICDGAGDIHRECYCLGLGVITAERAKDFEDDPDFRARARPLPPVPEYTGRRCVDCAFNPDSPEREGFTAADLFARLWAKGAAFFCHAGMHEVQDGRYIPRQRDDNGAPVGHPICAGWVREYERRISEDAENAESMVDRIVAENTPQPATKRLLQRRVQQLRRSPSEDDPDPVRVPDVRLRRSRHGHHRIQPVHHAGPGGTSLRSLCPTVQLHAWLDC